MLCPARGAFLRQAAVSAAVLSLFAAAPAAAQAALSANAASGVNIETLPQITVEASGAAAAKPDRAQLQVSVEQEAPSAKEAMEKVNQSLVPLLAALRKSLPEKDIQSSGFDVSPVYRQDDSGKSGNSRPERRFRASAGLALKLADIKQLGAVIDTALANGATGIADVSQTNSDLEALYAQARRQAIAAAMAKTAAYAQAAGVSPGRVLRIDESGADAAPRFLARAAAPMMAETPAAEGENRYTARITMTTELVNKTRR